MIGEETLLTGPEAPSLTASSHHAAEEDWAAAEDDPFADYFTDGPADEPAESCDELTAAVSLRQQQRPDGLVLEVEDDITPTAEETSSTQVARPRPDLASLRNSPAIQTANELGQNRPQATDFQVGQQVHHADYGDGTIERISGTGPRAIAAVRFADATRTRSFVLAHGGLQPLN